MIPEGIARERFGFHQAPERILIKPQSFAVEQRVEASAKATALGKGLMMELHSSHTEYYADASVPIGHVAIYEPKEYKGMPEYVITLSDPTMPWSPHTEKLPETDADIATRIYFETWASQWNEHNNGVEAGVAALLAVYEAGKAAK